MEIRRSELTLLFAHYDYFTGRAIRIMLHVPQGIESMAHLVNRLEQACQCIVLAKKNNVRYVSAEAREVAHDAYRTLRSVCTDLQLKVLECCAVSTTTVVQKALLTLLERELGKLTQTEIV